MAQMKVEYIDHMGNDLSVVRAATASFAKDPVEWDEAKHPRLINYLARGMTQADYDNMVEYLSGGQQANSISRSPNLNTQGEVAEILEAYRRTPIHWSPLAHTAITLRLKAPIAIHAQAMKHTVGFAHNTVSRRYVSETPELFIPDFRLAPEGNVKQGSGDIFDVMYYACDGTTVEPTIEFKSSNKAEVQSFIKSSDKVLFLTSKDKDDLLDAYTYICDEAIRTYNALIDLGVAPEQARFVLPQGVMTEWVWSGSLQAWARFYNQRSDSHAQREIQFLAHEVDKIVGDLFPVSWQALTN